MLQSFVRGGETFETNITNGGVRFKFVIAKGPVGWEANSALGTIVTFFFVIRPQVSRQVPVLIEFLMADIAGEEFHGMAVVNMDD